MKSIIKRIILQNGMNLILIPSPKSKELYFDLAFKVGSRHENGKNNGITHLLEHLSMYQALTKLVKSNISEHPFISVNAYTLKNRTNFELTLSISEIKEAILFVKSIFSKLEINHRQLKNEKNILREEFAEINSNQYIDLQKHFRMAFYGHHPLSLAIEGRQKNIENITIKELNRHHKEYFDTANSVLTVAGNFNEKQIINSFRQLATSFRKPAEVRTFTPKINNKLKFIDKKWSQNFIGLYFPIKTENIIQNIKNEFFTDVLGQYIHLNIQKDSLLYRINTDWWTDFDYTYLYIDSWVTPKNSTQLFRRISYHLDNFINKISEKNLEKYKKTVLRKMETENTLRDQANYASWNVLTFDRLLTMEDQNKIIKEINFDDIKYCYQVFMKNQKKLALLMGRFKDSDKNLIRDIFQQI